jgi:hypothetical protein
VWLIAMTANADPCDGKPGTFLYKDQNCTVPIEPRFGDTADEKEMKSTYEVWACKAVKSITMTEAKRRTRIADDLKTIVDSIRKDRLGAEATSTCDVQSWTKELAYKRGTLVISAKGADDKELQAATVVTGPTEHWFLGFDLPVTDQETLKFDSTTQTLLPKDKETQLYLSLNYLLGDILVDVDEKAGVPRRWTDNFSIKLFVQASSRPLDSAGVGLGYRVPSFEVKSLNLGLKGLNLYGGYFWTKQDEIVNGAPVENGDRDGKWRFGVTFDVGSMIETVKW